jgi:signal transduction histidine kinase
MKIKTRLLVSFLLLALVPLIAASSLFLVLGRNSLRDQALRNLQSTAEIQKKRVEGFLNDNLEHLQLDVRNKAIEQSLESYLSGGGTSSQAAIAADLQNILASTPAFEKASVLGEDGRVIASTDQSLTGKNLSGATYFQAGKDTSDQHAFAINKNGKLIEYLAAPIEIGGRKQGVLAIELSADELTDLMTDYTGLGKTGETVLAEKTPSGDALFLGPTRFGEKKSLTTSVPGWKSNVPINVALSGRAETLTGSIDYRGKPVLAATQFINDPRLGLVVKVDRSEAFAAVNQLLAVFIVVIGIVITLVVVASLLLAGSITRPIVGLTGVAEAVSAGDLTKRSGIERSDEVGMLAHAFDRMTDNLVSEREGLERKVEERTAELARSNLELDGYAHTVSHDLRGPLASIELAASMLTDMLKDEQQQDAREQMSEVLDQLRKSTDRSFSLVDELLALAEAGRHPAAVEKVDVGDMVAQVLLERAQVMEARGARVILDDGLGTLLASPTHMYQLFSNLITNAIKHNDSPEPVVEVRRLEEDEGGGLRYQVADNGPGVADEDFPRIFEPFFKGKGGETGVGLATVQKIVQQYGGTISACNEEGGGACFEFVLHDYEAPGSETAG